MSSGAAASVTGSNPRFAYAGFWRRVLAALIDTMSCFIPLAFVALPFVVLSKLFVGSPTLSIAGGIFFAMLPLLLALAFAFYFAKMESSRWQATIGKKILGLCVTDDQGGRLSLRQAMGRNLAKFVSSMTAGVGYVMCGFTKRKQCLHDMMAHCLVLRRT